jgi:D-sedoheptulose 7-phosphate isomerase
MMPAMLNQRIEQQFIDSADFMYQCGQALAAPLESAVEALLAGLTSGGKVLCAGAGPTAALAAYVAHLMLTGFERDRPELAALCLTQSDGEEAQSLVRRLRALSVAEDVLLVISVVRAEGALIPLIEAAQDRGVTVVAVIGGEGGDLVDCLLDTDVVISVTHSRLSRILEVQHLVLHCLCDGIDAQLLGEDNKE